MLEIGLFHKLEIIKEDDNGLILDGLNLNDILLPKKETPEVYNIGDKLNVFLYRNSTNRIVATFKEPYILLEGFAYLEVVDVNRHGAFLDWGLDKNLFLPFPEQEKRVEDGRFYVVKMLLDNKDRLIASTIINDFVGNEDLTVKEGQKVNIIVYRITDLGYLSIINNEHFGIIYKNEVFRPLKTGDKLDVYVKKIRKDNKIDLSIHNTDIKRFDEFTDKVLQRLQEEKVLNLTDKSSPDDIYKEFQMSKKNFKKAVGALYRKRLIKIDKDSITLL